MKEAEFLLCETVENKTWYETIYQPWKEKRDTWEERRSRMSDKLSILQAFLYLIKKYYGRGMINDSICVDDLLNKFLSHEDVQGELYAEIEAMDTGLKNVLRDILKKCDNEYCDLYRKYKRACNQVPEFTEQDAQYYRECNNAWKKAHGVSHD